MNKREKFFRVAVIFTLGFFLSVIFQNCGGVLLPRIREGLGCSDQIFNIAVSGQFLAMGLAQLPVGVLLDRYGPRRVQSGAFLIAAIGAGIASMASGGGLLFLGRSLIGFGMGGALMVAFKAVRLFYSYEEIPLWNNVIFCLGSLGIIMVGVPLHWILESKLDWRSVLLFLSISTLIVAALTFLSVPEKSDEGRKSGIGETILGIRVVLKDRFFWKVAPLMVSVLSIFNAWQGLWMIVWLMKVDGLSSSGAAAHFFFIGSGTILGALSSLFVMRLFHWFRISIDWTMAWGSFAAIMIQLLILFQIGSTQMLWFFYAFFSIFTLLSYAALMQHFAQAYAGRASTALNMLFFFALVIFQYILGFLAELCSKNAEANYKVVMWTYIAIQLLTFTWFCSQKRFTIRGAHIHVE